MFAICDNGDNESISELCACSNHFEAISKFCIKFSSSCIFKTYSWPPLLQTCFWGMCYYFVLLLICFFLCLSSVFLAVTFCLLICLSKYCPWPFPFHHFYCFLLSGHYAWWDLCNTLHSLISSMSCLIIVKPCWVSAELRKKPVQLLIKACIQIIRNLGNYQKLMTRK